MSSPLSWTGFLRSLLVLLALAFPVISPAGEPAPRDYVTDEAGIIGEDARRGISARLAELEGKTGAQMLVLTVLSTQGVPIEEFALRKAEAWKLGQKGKDNGLLLVVAVRDRKYRLEVGYGLEGVIPDSMAGTIGRQVLVPSFRKGDYAGGISAAVLVISDAIAKSQGVTLSSHLQGPERSSREKKEESLPLELILFLVVFGSFILLSQFSGTRRRSSWGRSAGGFGTFGGGGFRGGFGGFGGGGGGGFGGGGASGGW